MKKISILHLINSMDPGGAENLLKFQIPYFDKNRFDIHVGYLRGEGSLLRDKNNIKIIDFSKNGRFTFSSIFKIRKYVKNQNIVIIHGHLIHSSIISKLISFTDNKIKSIVTRHYAHASKANRLINKIENYLLPYHDKIICISKYVRNYLINMGIKNKKLKVIYNGINLDLYKNLESTKSKYFTIGTIGRLDTQKGIDTLLESFKQIIITYPNTKLEIIGDGPLKKEYMNLSLKLGLENNVTFVGYIQPNEVRLKAASWDLFILASRWEGFGMVLIEAGAMGLPVIATNVEAIPEIIIDNYNGFLVNPDSPKEISDKSLHLISSPLERSKLCNNGFNNVKKYFSIIKMVNETEKLYKEILFK